MGTLLTEVVAREPFPDWALPVLWLWIEAVRRRVADDYGPKSFDEFLADWEARRGSRRTWGVWRDRQLGGMVSIEPVNPDVVVTHAIFKRDFWGRQTTMPALSQVYTEVFRQGVNKITSMIFADNYEIRALALALGAVEETDRRHPLKAATRRAGELVDMRVISLFREDFKPWDS